MLIPFIKTAVQGKIQTGQDNNGIGKSGESRRKEIKNKIGNL